MGALWKRDKEWRAESCIANILLMRGALIALMMGVLGIWTPSIHAQDELPVMPVQNSGSQRIQQKDASKAGVQNRSSRVLVSLDVRDSSIAFSVREIARQAGLRVGYNESDSALRTRKSVKVRNVPYDEALKELLAGTGLAAKVTPDGKILMLGPQRGAESQGAQQADDGVISGRVTDSATGRGLHGVTVSVRGTKLTKLTDANGDFTLTGVPVGERTLDIKLLGYLSLARTVVVSDGKTATVRAALRPSATMLSGVVTTATGQQKKVEVGYSAVTLNVDSLMQVAPIMNVTDLLETRVPGMMIQHTSGSPGDPATIRIRGEASVYANNDPIVIVDGIRLYSQISDRDQNLNNANVSVGNSLETRSYRTPSPLDQIDPNTIETIEVLRGPSASAMYGSDAANGVIIITTKRGKIGRTTYSVTGNAGLTSMPYEYPTGWFKWVTPEYGGLSVLCDGYCPGAHVDSVLPFQALNDPRLTAFGTGRAFGGSVGANGGISRIRYNYTVSASHELGVLKLPQVDAERFFAFQGFPAPGWMRRPDRLTSRSANARMDVELSERVNVGVSSVLTQQTQYRTGMSMSTGGVVNALRNIFIDLSQFREEPLLGSRANPYERVTSRNITMTNSATINSRVFSWLPLNGTVGFGTVLRNNASIIPRGYMADTNRVGVWNGSTQNMTDLTGNLRTRIPVQQRLNIAAGLDWTSGTTDNQSGGFANFEEGVTDPSAGLTTTSNQFFRRTSERKTFGWFLEPQVNVQSRFFVMPGFRLDHNGLSGKNARLNGLPKMNMSWVVSDEPLFPWKDVFRLFRVRLAFGEAGVQPRREDGLRLYVTPGVANSIPAGTVDTRLQLSQIGNTRLRPERGSEVEGGFDLEAWNGRLSLEVTQFRKQRKDAQLRVNYATSAGGGGSSRLINVGDFLNTGTEINLNARLLERRAVGVSMMFNLSRVESRILRVTPQGDSASQDGTLGRQLRVGYPLNGKWYRPIVGYADIDGDGAVSPQEVSVGFDPVFVGSEEPSFQMNWSPTLLLFNGRISATAALNYIHGRYFDYDLGGASRFRVNAPDVSLDELAAYATSGGSSQTPTKIGSVGKGNTLTWRSVSINYHAGPRIAKLAGARNVNISAQGSNLGTWNRYNKLNLSMTDPTATLPNPRLWQLRLALGY